LDALTSLSRLAVVEGAAVVGAAEDSGTGSVTEGTVVTGGATVAVGAADVTAASEVPGAEVDTGTLTVRISPDPSSVKSMTGKTNSFIVFLLAICI